MTDDDLERLLFYMPIVAQRATDLKARAFARDMVKRQRFRNWKPTPKQIAWMRRLVADLFIETGDEVIDAAD